MATWWTLATSRRAGATTDVRVRGGRLRNAFGEPPTIQDLYGLIAVDAERKSQIVRDVAHAVASGRSPLVLSGRTDHVEWLGARLRAHAERVSLLKGGMGPKQRTKVTQELAVTEGCPRIIVATGSYVGEGFDDSLRNDARSNGAVLSRQAHRSAFVATRTNAG
jgi:hypothetical protein